MDKRYFFEIDKTNKEGLAFFHWHYQKKLLRGKKYDCIEEELVAVFNTIVHNGNAEVEEKGSTRSVVSVGEFQSGDRTNPFKREFFNRIMFLSRGAIRQIKTEGVFFQPYKDFNRKSIIKVDYNSPGEYLQERYRRKFHDPAPIFAAYCLRSIYDCYITKTGNSVNGVIEFNFYSNEEEHDKILDDLEEYSHGQVTVVERNCKFDLCFNRDDFYKTKRVKQRRPALRLLDNSFKT